MQRPEPRPCAGVFRYAPLLDANEIVLHREQRNRMTLTVFGVFSVVYLQQAVTWNQIVGFALIAAGAFFVFRTPL
jgi:uncharacterized protein (DUF486 family)